MGLSRMHFSGLSLSMHLSGLSLSSLSEGLALLLLHPQHGRPLRSIGIFFFSCSPPGSSFHGISQARILEGTAISFSNSGISYLCVDL